ncbi:MAG: hypothetical protein A3J76_03860 [Candidatus Moranbacteria bacterium RBG_13_45_13]|nr:MAG: hypothetical protein A3J76_03860 [Candidatus Moranbacteria bacterium RBG_13_45_13]
MVWELGVFIITLLYLGTLWVAYVHPESLLWPGAIFLLILFVATKIISKKFFHFILPTLLFFGTVLLLPLIDSPAQVKTFLALSVGVFYLAILGAYRLGKYEKDLTAKAMSNLAAFSALFAWFAAGYGWYLNYEFPAWIIMTVFAIVTFLVSYALVIINQLHLDRFQRILYSIFLAYLMAGVIWVQDFWPFGYLTTGVIALIIYYSGWEVIRSHFLGKLNVRRIVFSIVFLVGAVAILLLSTKWYPVI